MSRKALILVNTGTPDSPGVKDVRRFLTAFLNDRRVIDLSWLARKILVNLIIVPFRAPRSAALYRQLWTAEGSPLLVNLQKLVSGLQEMLGESCDVTGAMRYGNPSLEKIFNRIAGKGYDEIIVFPMYPHYASSTTGSVHELVMKQASELNVIAAVRFISQYYSHPIFLEAWTATIGRYNPEGFDHILFSYHGLPLRQVGKIHPGISCNDCSCTDSMPEHGKYCYRAACYETTRLIAGKLGLAAGSFSTAYQSRLTTNWLSPFTDKVLTELASSGKKRVLVVAPSFTADCLETVVEIGHEYKSLFGQAGGEELVMAESLNDSRLWMKAITEITELKTERHDKD